MDDLQNENNNIPEILLKYLEDIVFIINENLICEFVNQKFFNSPLNNDNDNNIIGKPIIPIIFVNNKIKGEEFFKKLFENSAYSDYIKIVFDNLERYWFEIIGRQFYDKDGKSKAILFLRDITALKEAEEKFKFITDNTNDLISVYNKI
ncbi:MAG: hypothetical protein ACTSPW_10915 [Promethearchaeota archaeon]